MKGMVTIVTLIGMMLFVSCSWTKRTNPALTAPANTERVVPSPTQQEAAMQLLKEEMNGQEEGQEKGPLVIRDPQLEDGRSANEDENVDMLPDPAQQRGLRSPALPKLLPMDINGKLNPGL